jgi:hypothetical protein
MLPLDVEVQIEQLAALGAAADRIYIDCGFSGKRARPPVSWRP